MKHWVDGYLELLADRVAECQANGDERGRLIYERVATEISAKRVEYDDAELTTAQASAESGFTTAALSRLRGTGQWSGKRKDLPRHANAAPHARTEKRSSNVVSIADRALAGKNGAPRARSRSV